MRFSRARRAGTGRPAGAGRSGPEVPGYRLSRGLGGSGAVHSATSDTTGGAVIVSVVEPGPGTEKALRRRLRHLLTAPHPHLPKVLDVVDVPGGGTALVTEVVPGASLAAIRVARGALTRPEIAGVITDIGSALAHLAGAGVVHGDVSPANVVVDTTGRVVLVDLVGDVTIERGTPGHIPPERRAGAPASAASDVWALGAMARALAPEDAAVEALTRQALVEDPEGRPSARALAARAAELGGRAGVRLPSGADLAGAILREGALRQATVHAPRGRTPGGPRGRRRARGRAGRAPRVAAVVLVVAAAAAVVTLGGVVLREVVDDAPASATGETASGGADVGRRHVERMIVAAGTEVDGAVASGSENAGIEAAGTGAGGTEAAGTGAGGTGAAGTGAGGTGAAGTGAGGTEAAGTGAAGTGAAGTEAAGTEAAATEAGAAFAVVADVMARREAALLAGDAAGLAASTVPGSAARTADAPLIESLGSTRITGLQTEVAAVAVLDGSVGEGRFTAELALDQTQWVSDGPEGATTHPSRRACGVLAFRLEGEGWAIEDSAVCDDPQ